MRRMFCGGLLAALVAASVGCSGQSTPTQPTLTDQQIQETMKKGKMEAQKERGNRGPGGVPLK